MEMIHTRIDQAGKIALFTHVNPDGDALGSTIGMMGFLDSLGKESTLFLPSAQGASLDFIIPEQYRGRVMVYSEEKATEILVSVQSCDLVIGLDFNSLERIKPLDKILQDATGYKILIDHHVAPQTQYFDLVYSCTEVSSTCELLYTILKKHPSIDGDASKMNVITREALMTGMTTDSNNFANSVYPGTLAMASELLQAGTDREKIIQNIYFKYPMRRLRAEGYVLGELMQVTPEGLGYIILDREVQTRFGLQEGDTEGFVNKPLSLDGVRLSIMLKQELNGNKIRVSLRSKRGTSARDCSGLYFHGGGHELASGGKLIIGEDIAGIEDAAEYLQNVSRMFLKEQ